MDSQELREGQKSTPQARMRGLTLVELLVVITVLGLIISILIPAVLSARESARNLSCKANLKQLGIALNNYLTQHDCFPPNGFRWGKQAVGNDLSGFTFLLPFLEQTALYNSCNWDSAQIDSRYGSINNATIISTKLDVLLCPSEATNRALNTYRFNFGTWTDPAGRESSEPTGPFGGNNPKKPSAILDGLSNTAFLAERNGGTVEGRPNPLRDIKVVRLDKNYISEKIYISQCHASKSFVWNLYSGSSWFFTGMDYTQYNHNGVPNDPRPSCGGTDFGLHPPRSYHGGGLNVLFGDSHVGFEKDSIDPIVWRSLGTPAQSD